MPAAIAARAIRDIERLLREDPKLKVVWREWPVLGPDSEAAARASLAAAQAGRFKPFYDAPVRRRPADAGRGRQGARRPSASAATSPPRPPTASSQRNFELARDLEATGTPTFVVGDQILQGAVGYEALRDAIKEARAKKLICLPMRSMGRGTMRSLVEG